MNRILLLLLLTLFISYSCLAQGTAQIRFSIVDRSGNSVSDISTEDLSLLEGKTPLLLTGIESLKEKPVAAMIFLDNSVSQEKVLPDAKLFAAGIIRNVLRKNDLVSVVEFSDTFKELISLTGNFAEALTTLDGIQIDRPPDIFLGSISKGKPPISPGTKGSTGIWDTLFFIATKEYAGIEKYRKVIFLITDGVNTGGEKSVSDAVNSLNKAGIAVYAIGIGDEFYSGVSQEGLEKITARTGGKAYFPKQRSYKKPPYREEKEYSSISESLKQRLASEYILNFTPNQKPANKKPELKLSVINPEKKKLDHELSYQENYSVKN